MGRADELAVPLGVLEPPRRDAKKPPIAEVGREAVLGGRALWSRCGRREGAREPGWLVWSQNKLDLGDCKISALPSHKR